MIKIHKIEATNIRSLGHAVLEPLIDGGMTAVNGPNGVGKSSLLTALVWALYGVTPDGVPQNAMRRQGSTGDCRVVVTFEHDGQILTVERGLKGVRDSTYMKVHVGDVEQAFGKIRACEAWIVDRFGGLDAEGFLTAFVVQQKELDGLVKAKPAERRKLIERLAGIDRMSAALKSARDEETEVKKRLDLLPGDPEAVQAARDELDAAQQRAVDLWADYEKAETTAKTAAAALIAAEAAAMAVQDRVTAHSAAKDALIAARHNADLANERASVAERELAAMKSAAVGGTDAEVTAAREAYTAATEAVADNKAAREVAERAIAEADRARTHASRLADRATAARNAATQAAAAAASAAHSVAQYPTTLSADIDTATVDHAALQERVGALRGEHERLSASIRAMEATDAGDSHCPTCSTPLPDPSLLLATLREAHQRVQHDGAAASADSKTLETTLATLRRQSLERDRAQQNAEHLTAQAEAAETAATNAEQEATDAAREATTAAEAAETAKREAMAAATATAALVETADAAGNTLRAAQNAAAALARVPDAETAARNANRASIEAADNVTHAEAAEESTRVPAEEQEAALTGYRIAQRDATAAEQAKTSTHGDFRVAEEQVKSAERVRDAEEARMRARAEAFEALERCTAVREALDAFRRNRIASLAPELSEIATDQIAGMTDGKFVAVELDEEFTPVITDDQGNRRPASWLSGGEESAVALALRLAIGEVIAGQQGGLLWMDEPQTAMDASRRPAMMSVIRELPGRQPIIISHVSEATDMVDLVLEVIPDDENGSSVVTGGNTNIVTEALLDAVDA